MVKKDDNEKLARNLVRLLSTHNFWCQDDSLCLKTGGEGDNGEELIDAVTALLEEGRIELTIKEGTWTK